MKLAVVDYGMGNLHSVLKAVQFVAPEITVYLAETPEKINKADKVLLPGQGAILGCMNNIKAQNLQEALLNASKNKPFLGICIGPQLMTQHSTENGGVEALGMIPNRTKRFSDGLKIKIPHMGWNTVKQTVPHHLWTNIPDNSYFYYVHSYHISLGDNVIGTTEYGETFTACIAQDNIAGLQAHPEKSSTVGLQFLKNFITWQI